MAPRAARTAAPCAALMSVSRRLARAA
jgi:hypothetical protein